MSVLVWWTIIKHMRDFFRSQEEFDGVDVRAGAKKPKDPYSCLEILWDEETGVILYKPSKGFLTLWLDYWVRSDNRDPGVAYEKLFVLQSRGCEVLLRWQAALLRDLGFATKLTLGQAVSDGDGNRPVAGSRMVLNIEWRKGGHNQ